MLDTDALLDAIRTQLLAGIAELSDDKAVVVWHQGESDPDDDIKNGIAKTKGVSVLIYDEGGAAAEDADTLACTVALELYVDTTKRQRKNHPTTRYASEIRNAIMRLLHRNPSLRQNAPYFDCRVKSYTPLADPDYAAWQIVLSHTIYLEPDL